MYNSLTVIFMILGLGHIVKSIITIKQSEVYQVLLNVRSIDTYIKDSLPSKSVLGRIRLDLRDQNPKMTKIQI